MSSTKTVSFRLPMDEYIKYLQKATAMNLGPADYALLKIYSQERENEEISSLKASYTQLESEYEDFKTKVREEYQKELAKATDRIKAEYEVKLKAKDLDYNEMSKQSEDLAKKLQQTETEKQEIETQNENVNNQVAELQKKLLKAEERAKLQMQTSADATAKEIQKKNAVIQELQTNLESAKQANKQLTVTAKETMKKAEQYYTYEKKRITDEYNAKVKATLPKMAKDKSLFTSDKVFVDKWEKELLIK